MLFMPSAVWMDVVQSWCPRDGCCSVFILDGMYGSGGRWDCRPSLKHAAGNRTSTGVIMSSVCVLAAHHTATRSWLLGTARRTAARPLSCTSISYLASTGGFRAGPRDALEGGGGGNRLRGTQPTTATVSLTPSASMPFVTDSNRPQPLWQPPPTTHLTAPEASSEPPSLRMHPWLGPQVQPQCHECTTHAATLLLPRLTSC